jgi:ATP-dependent Lon protease
MRLDKVGKDFRGDLLSALLEVLDPEQIHLSTDNLSTSSNMIYQKFCFIATANSLPDYSALLCWTGWSLSTSMD